MEAVLAGRDSLLVLPTGGGKSLCFQAPAIASDGLAIVVSPLISLMKDQVDTLVGNGVPAACYNSSLPSEQKSEVARGVRDGHYRLLYVAPERLVGDGGDGFLNMLSARPISFIAIDEAHCISQWGHDFRPEYRQLARLRERWPAIGLHAYTATATARVRPRHRRAARPAQRRPSSSDRSIGRTSSTACSRDRRSRRRSSTCSSAIAARPASSIARRARKSTRIAAVAAGHRLARAAVSRRDGRRGAASQPGRVPERRDRPGRGDGGVRHGHRSIGRALRDPRRRAAVARALPAGIGPRRPRRPRGRVRADLLGRGLPQVARDAREERRAVGRAPRRCCATSSATPPASAAATSAWSAISARRSRRTTAARATTASASSRRVAEPVTVARKILSCVARVGQRFGAAHVTNVLRGSDSEQVRSRGHHELSVFGLMKDATIDELRGYIDQLLAHGLLQQTGDEYPVLQLTADGLALLKDAGAAPDLSLARQKRPGSPAAEARPRRDRRLGRRRSRSLRSAARAAPGDRAPPPRAAVRHLPRHARCARSRGRSRRRKRSCATSTASAIGRPKTWGRWSLRLSLVVKRLRSQVSN